MAQEDALTLAARIKDEFSGPVRDMTKAWNQFSDILKHGHAEGSKAAKEQAKEVNELGERCTAASTPTKSQRSSRKQSSPDRSARALAWRVSSFPAPAILSSNHYAVAWAGFSRPWRSRWLRSGVGAITDIA
jgi:hypothetical protein